MNIYDNMLLFESYNEIESLCERYGITNYTIRPDGLVDVDGNVYLLDRGLSKLPLKFGRVSGNFYCSDNQLTTLEGAPESVLGYFGCNNNQLTTLEGGPKSVGGRFNCSYNKLTTLEGAPYYRYLGGDMYCRNNPVEVLWRLFDSDYEKFMMSLDWDYIRGNKIIRVKFEDALAEIGKTPPKSIKGYKYNI